MNVEDHPIFQRQGNDILCEVALSFSQASNGAEITVPTLDGETSINILPGTQTGKVFCLREEGIPFLYGSGRGDEYVLIAVDNHAKI